MLNVKIKLLKKVSHIYWHRVDKYISTSSVSICVDDNIKEISYSSIFVWLKISNVA